MDYRCPSCRADLGSRKQVHSIVARMEMDCSRCGGRIRVNVHPLEQGIVFGSFGTFGVLAALGYVLQSSTLVLLALAVGMAGAAALPVIERTCLRNWARYQPPAPDSGADRS